MRFGVIGAAAAALCVAVPAQAAVVTVQIDAYATGTTDKIASSCGGICSSAAVARYFTYSYGIDLAEGASTTFQFGPNSNAGVSIGTITRSGYDIWGAVYYVGSDFRFSSVQLQNQPNAVVGITSTELRASSFTVRQIIPAPVPEPATWAMMILGFGVAGWSLRRRKVAMPALS